MRILNRLFGMPEEINGGERCPTYLHRWTVLKLWAGRGIYLHHFVEDDWSRDLHDHPKRFISIGLKGGYIEMTPDGKGGERPKVFKAPWARSFPATHIHRLRMIRKWNGEARDCWTLVIVLKATRDWGFWHEGRWIHWRSYVKGDDAAIADRMKACD